MNDSRREVTRIVLANERREVRSALRLLFDQEPDLMVVAEASAAEYLGDTLDAKRPDLVLVDWDLPLRQTAVPAELREDVVARVRQRQPLARVVVLGNWPSLRSKALCAGADGYVSKVDPPEEVLRAVRISRRHGPDTVGTARRKTPQLAS